MDLYSFLKNSSGMENDLDKFSKEQQSTETFVFLVIHISFGCNGTCEKIISE